MRKNPYPGKFIVFEGLDGSGQSTQVKLLAEFLKRKKHQVLTTKEPTLDSTAGKLIRKVLDKKKKIPPQKLQELYARDRQEHLKKVIIPALKKGKTVISDRYFFSSFAYGGLDVPFSYLLKINDKFLLPDLVFFINTKPETCILRIDKRGKKNTFFECKDKLEKVYWKYKKILKKFKNVVVINGEISISRIHQEIKKYV
ncbi:dTMP kinase [Candidatus Jorgensenbacteria bacterium RIFCSPLOWO2_12_FULL_42_11]|uniref:Thymidylate kinase n=1 Tax=Candidatus Jorgensenbacteria bacterium RIFCSPLOWO2_12_FULL_42_11 TaxID=1798473 RepID=A0A1F6C0X9_9BACT|nr:MAG: dTMP kinase [Candidatus Jorgensenbacteria bacterium RIFCSPLOWO2_12_FULL_42_11]